MGGLLGAERVGPGLVAVDHDVEGAAGLRKVRDGLVARGRPSALEVRAGGRSRAHLDVDVYVAARERFDLDALTGDDLAARASKLRSDDN